MRGDAIILTSTRLTALLVPSPTFSLSCALDTPHLQALCFAFQLIRIFVDVYERADYFSSPSPSSSLPLFEPASSAARCYSLLTSFLLTVISRTVCFSDELLSSSLTLLLSSPLRFVASHLPPLARAMRSALRLGHRPLALTSLSSLERWLDQIAPPLLTHLPSLLPSVASYLTISVEGGLEGRAERERSGRRNNTLANRERRRRGREGRLRKGEDAALQHRVVALLGKVGGKVMTLCGGEGRWREEGEATFGDEDGTGEDGRWRSGGERWGGGEEVLGINLCLLAPEPDLRGEEGRYGFYLDSLLPRVAELAVSSVSYREKAAACELLDGAIKLCVGRVAKSSDSRQEERFSPLLSHLFPAMLSLAADADSFARKLFEPLTNQVGGGERR